MVAKSRVKPDYLERWIDAGLDQAEENRSEGGEVIGLLRDFDEESFDGFFEHCLEVSAGGRATGLRFDRRWRFEDDRVHWKWWASDVTRDRVVVDGLEAINPNPSFFDRFSGGKFDLDKGRF